MATQKASTSKTTGNGRRPASNGAGAGTAKTAAKSEAAKDTTKEFLVRNALPLSLVVTGLGILATKSINGGDNAVSRSVRRAQVEGQARASALAAEWGERGRVLRDELKWPAPTNGTEA